MSFKEWLPITTRNRVALGLAFAAFVAFVVWNCFPYYPYTPSGEPEPNGIVAVSLWPRILSPDFYLTALKNPSLESFLGLTCVMALIQNSLVTTTIVPFWKLLHSTPYVRLLLAAVNLIGGCAILWHMIDLGTDERFSFWASVLQLMAVSMFTLSAALFTFKNELALRDAKKHGTPSGGE